MNACIKSLYSIDRLETLRHVDENCHERHAREKCDSRIRLVTNYIR
jgi:hypothetical protein